MMTTRKMPKESAIRQYWADGARWREMGVDRPETVLSKDVCMACEFPLGTQRAHIKARSAGGPDSVDNLHMLFRYCHAESEYIEGETYWRWFDRQNKTSSFDTLFARYGISAAKAGALSDSEQEIARSLLREIRLGNLNPHVFSDRLADVGIDVRL